MRRRWHLPVEVSLSTIRVDAPSATRATAMHTEFMIAHRYSIQRFSYMLTVSFLLGRRGTCSSRALQMPQLLGHYQPRSPFLAFIWPTLPPRTISGCCSLHLASISFSEVEPSFISIIPTLVADFLSTLRPNDVVLRFKDARCLWANSKVISMSPLLADILSSEFDESTKVAYSFLVDSFVDELPRLFEDCPMVDQASTVAKERTRHSVAENLEDSDEEENCGREVAAAHRRQEVSFSVSEVDERGDSIHFVPQTRAGTDIFPSR